MSLYQFKAYIRHLLTAGSTAGHGIHSPFIYNFLTTVIRSRTDEAIIMKVEALRAEMIKDFRIINVTDLGAGSLKHKSPVRSISSIARFSALPGKQAALLARMAQGIGQGVQGIDEDEGILLELGTSLGISTLALALAAPGRKVISVEGCPELASLAADNLKRYGAENAEVMNAEFTQALNVLKERRLKVSFVFIDGNHNGNALRSYISTVLSMGDEMLIAADDIHLSSDMYRAWSELTESGVADASLETKRFGIIYKRKSLTPGRYRIWC